LDAPETQGQEYQDWGLDYVRGVGVVGKGFEEAALVVLFFSKPDNKKPISSIADLYNSETNIGRNRNSQNLRQNIELGR